MTSPAARVSLNPSFFTTSAATPLTTMYVTNMTRRQAPVAKGVSC
jgi:hypothetical protein